MTRYQCIREIFESFDFYDEYAERLSVLAGQHHGWKFWFDRPYTYWPWDAGVRFRVRLYGCTSSDEVTDPGRSCRTGSIDEASPSRDVASARDTRRTIFKRVYRAYVFKGVREGHKAGLDYLSICYAFCRRLAARGYDRRWGGFSMHTWACLKTGKLLEEYRNKFVGDPEKVSLKKKLAFLRAERLKRKTYKELNREQ